jgi:thioredoxin-like negative regulator of GroEL
LLVGECLDRGDTAAAALNLDRYVRAHPDQPMFRFQLAELYLRCDQLATAKYQYERFADDARIGPSALRTHLVTAEIKLLEIAQRRNDHFGELYHRGAGLLLLVQEQDTPAERNGKRSRADSTDGAERDEPLREEMLCKALAALTEAKRLKPANPRLCEALAQAYDLTGNTRAAEAERAAARASVVSGGTAAPRRLE